MRALLSDRRVLLFYAASAVSALGDNALYLALAVWVKELTNSTSLAALDIGAVAAGMMFARPPASWSIESGGCPC